MRKINNRQELNQYYTDVDFKLKKYIDEHKVTPNELLVYIKRNLKEFKMESGLDDIVGVDQVIFDILNHYHHSQLDKILTFESFRRIM